MTNTTRDEFEAWAKTNNLDITRGLDAWDCNIYKHSHIDAMSFGWQAATEQGKRQPLEGYQLVPIEPTPEMIEAGEAHTDTYDSGPNDFLQGYKAAISAALPPTATQQEQGKRQPLTDDVHSCSFFCDLPACIKTQRDLLRDQITKDAK